MLRTTKRGSVECRLHPLILGYGEDYAHMGNPELAQRKQSEAIVKHLNKISEQWDTKIAYADATLAPAPQRSIINQ